MGRLAERPLRTVVVGGGPGGLFYALLAKQRFPRHEVVLYERNPPDATFGFGVVFSERTLGGLAAADPLLHVAMQDAGVAWEDIEVRREGDVMRCGGHGFSAISRKVLLQLMRERARDIGVELHFEREAGERELEGADLVIAADGVNSTIRDELDHAFAPEYEQGEARYIWFATRQGFDALTFVFVESEHGHWGLHAYPFDDHTSTFIVETDPETWRRAGLDLSPPLPPGQSDMASLRYCEEIFADHLGGHGLLENNSKWLSFQTLRCGIWRSGNVALIGDAAHTAHFSVGSGTKMAMEDALAVVDAVAVSDAVSDALGRYEAARRPQVEHIQAAARPSRVWWERFRHLRDRPTQQFAFHFLSRSPSVTRARLLARDRGFVRRVDEWALAAFGDRSPLAAPIELGPLRLQSRLVAAPEPEPDPLVAVAGAAQFGAGLVLTPNGPDRGEVAAWVHEHSTAAAAIQLGADASAQEAERAAAEGFDVVAAPWDASALAAWPVDRLALAFVQAPADSESAATDKLLEAVIRIAGDRPLVVGVRGSEAAGDSVDQLLFCDRVVAELGLACCLVDGVESDDAAVTAVLAGRVDLVQGLPSLVSDRWRPSAALTRPGTAASASR